MKEKFPIVKSKLHKKGKEEKTWLNLTKEDLDIFLPKREEEKVQYFTTEDISEFIEWFDLEEYQFYDNTEKGNEYKKLDQFPSQAQTIKDLFNLWLKSKENGNK